MKYIQVKFPTLQEMVGFVRTNKPIINDYNIDMDILVVEDNEDNRRTIKYNRGRILTEPAISE